MELDIEWKKDETPIPYERAVSFMEDRVLRIRKEGAKNLVWLLEHPSLYTAGTSADPKDLLNQNLPVYTTGRGGQYTYHGPGQRVAYVMMDLAARGHDLRQYICDLEEWIILALKEFGIRGERRPGRVGIWVSKDGREDKISAIGVRVRKWVAYHGVSINVNPNLSHYAGIVPCGIKEHGVTSFQKFGVSASMAELDAALEKAWKIVFLK